MAKTLFGMILFVISLASAMAPAHADPKNDFLDWQRAFYGKACKVVDFKEGFLSADDYNHDTIEDIITNAGAVICDGEMGAECTILGCPYRIYAGNAQGGFDFAAEVQAFGFGTSFRYGVKIENFQIAASHCGKTTLSPCFLTTRLFGKTLLIISKEQD